MILHPSTMRRRFFGVVVGLVNIFNLPVHADDQAARIDPLATQFLATSKTPGVVIGILHNGEAHTFGYGIAIDGIDKPPDGDTLFEIGSVTKVFTAIALAVAVDRKSVTLDDRIQTLLP